jgi:hypothetical protein
MALLAVYRPKQTRPLSAKKNGAPLGFPIFFADIRAFDTLWPERPSFNRELLSCFDKERNFFSTVEDFIGSCKPKICPDFKFGIAVYRARS